MKKLLALSILILMLSACGNDDSSSSTSVSATSTTSKAATPRTSKLSAFMQHDTVCEIINIDTINKTFNASTEIQTKPNRVSKYSDSVTCNYNWKRADAKARENQMVDQMMSQVRGKTNKKLPMRQRTTDHSFSVRLEEYKGEAQYFMPPNLTEEQLQKQIAAAQKRASEKLTDEQKKVAGNMANTMMESLLRKNNKKVKVEGIGDAAYWTAVGQGSLVVLSGNIKMSISPVIADTEKQDIENAKNLANLILK